VEACEHVRACRLARVLSIGCIHGKRSSKLVRGADLRVEERQRDGAARYVCVNVGAVPELGVPGLKVSEQGCASHSVSQLGETGKVVLVAGIEIQRTGEIRMHECVVVARVAIAVGADVEPESRAMITPCARESIRDEVEVQGFE